MSIFKLSAAKTMCCWVVISCPEMHQISPAAKNHRTPAYRSVERKGRDGIKCWNGHGDLDPRS